MPNFTQHAAVACFRNFEPTNGSMPNEYPIYGPDEGVQARIVANACPVLFGFSWTAPDAGGHEVISLTPETGGSKPLRGANDFRCLVFARKIRDGAEQISEQI